MKSIVVISGSVRKDNYTNKAVNLVLDEAKKMKIKCNFIDPGKLSLPFPGQDTNDSIKKMQDTVKNADGVILATPEYHGSISSVMKLIIENLGFPSVLKEKTIALLGVAAGQIGAIKSLEQLRSICSHIGAIVLPGPVSVANVQKVFDEDGTCTDEKIEKRIRGLVSTLKEFTSKHKCPHALEKMVRS